MEFKYLSRINMEDTAIILYNISASFLVELQEGSYYNTIESIVTSNFLDWCTDREIIGN